MLWVVLPFFGGALVAASSFHDPLYVLLVREDSVLEWAQVAAYVVAVAMGVAAPRLWRAGERTSAVVALGLALAAFVSVGEELAWGQRLLGFGTPEIFAGNSQGEVTIHNDGRLEQWMRVAVLLAGLYGMLAPLLARPRCFVPPRAAVGLFAVVVAYFSARVILLERPSYAQAKFSEWPELCFALGLALWAFAATRRRSSRTAA